MREEVFGMRRANGDWFALDLDDQRRVLVFRSLVGAWRARAKNDELMLFWPVPVDERALAEFASADDGRPASFWLVEEDDPAADLRRGHALEYLQLATLEGLKHLPLRTYGATCRLLSIDNAGAMVLATISCPRIVTKSDQKAMLICNQPK